MFISLEQIGAATSRIPFTDIEIQALIEGVKVRRGKGTDLCVGMPHLATNGEEIREMASDGVIMLHSPEQLETKFLFAKCNAGKSLFGRQKCVYASYICDLHSDEWTVGPVFKMWAMAVTSIGNIYRSQGYR